MLLKEHCLCMCMYLINSYICVHVTSTLLREGSFFSVGLHTHCAQVCHYSTVISCTFLPQWHIFMQHVLAKSEHSYSVTIHAKTTCMPSFPLSKRLFYPAFDSVFHIKTTDHIFMIILHAMNLWTRKNWLKFVSRLLLDPGPGIF